MIQLTSDDKEPDDLLVMLLAVKLTWEGIESAGSSADLLAYGVT